MWRAILDGEMAERARSTIERIEAELGRRDIAEASFGNGQAGLAILHGYRARDGVDGAEERMVAAVERALANAADNPRPWLFFGYGGIAFVLQHLQAELGDADEPLRELDTLIATPVVADDWPYECELMLGLVGVGVYVLERGDRELLAQVLRHLERAAVQEGVGVVWRTRRDDEPVHVNLGLAHGIAGVVAFLARAKAKPEVLRAAVDGLLQFERDTVPRFTTTIGWNHPYEGRLDGWCYGDPSTAIALVRAARALDDRLLLDRAHRLAVHAARRTDDELALLAIDTGLCHGAASQAHLFNRLGQAFGDDELLVVARRWYERAIERCTDEELARLLPGMQTGLAGIALALLAGSSDVEPRWDRAFLVDLES